MVKLTEVMERALLGALSSASKIVAGRLIADGVPTVEILTEWISEAMEESSEALSQKAIDEFYSLEVLKTLQSDKVNIGTFMGMIKGECVQLGMRAASVYDLGLTLKVIAPAKAFAFDVDGAMKAVSVPLKSLGTKISSAIASYVSRAGIEKSDVLKVFSEYEVTLLEEIHALVVSTVGQVVPKLKTLQKDTSDEE